jgi:uncharacterized protein (DUF488 family)
MMREVFTAGHSTRSIEELVALLDGAGVRAVADVRRFPASRRHPHFAGDALAASLEAAGIAYHWLGASLGGRMRETIAAARSPNAAWKVAAFRHYADALDSAEVSAGLARLEEIAVATPTAFLCAERLWWQCHRRIVADALLVRGWRVVHLLEPGKHDVHALPDFAKVDGGKLSYPGRQPPLL